MHAIVVTVNVDPNQETEARRALHDLVVPRASSVPGFVAGYWTAPIEGRGMSMTVWADEKAAQAAAAMMRSVPPVAGVTIQDVEVREVIEHA